MKKTPKLRFKEFSGDWEIKKLGDLADIGTGKKDTQDKIEDGKYPFFVRSQIVERINSYSFDGEAILTAGDGVGVGKVFHYINGKFDYHQRVYKLSDFKEGISGRYIYEYFKKNFIREVTKYTAKTSVDSVRMEMITKMDIPCPSKEEQEKIANFFSLIDNKISLQSEKVEALKDYKKGIMQKIFSRELRFKDDEGRDYPEWEERKLGDIIDKGKAGGTPKSTVKDYYNGNINFLSISDMTNQGKYINYTEKTITELGIENSSAWLVPKNSLIYSMYASVGFVSINNIELATSQAMFSMIINENTNIDYVYHYLSYFKDNGIQAFIETGTQGNLNANTVKNIIIPYPNRDEQNKIASCISSIEIKIEKEQEKLNSLNEYKKGLLQQMFI